MKPDVENLIRSFEIPQLQVLYILTNAKGGISSNQEIISTTNTASRLFGSLLTPLRRKKINGECLIVPAGVDPDKGKRWQINENLVSIEALKELLIKMQIPEEGDL